MIDRFESTDIGVRDEAGVDAFVAVLSRIDPPDP
jgi:hypothetical protein